MDGRVVGRVELSHNPAFGQGDYVASGLGWRESFVDDGSALRAIDERAAPLTQYLGVLGGTGMTAYVGLLDICNPQVAETVFVSGAAGAVGLVAGQLAKIRGCRVVGSAGSEAKVDLLTREIGYDAAFDYKTAGLPQALAEHCPDGIDVYFDNVGGDHLEAALDAMNDFGRIFACGAISLYNLEEPEPGPNNMSQMIRKRLRMQGFIVSDHMERQAEFQREMLRWLGEGQVQSRETLVDGIENAAAAFMGLFQGENVGEMVVRLDPEAPAEGAGPADALPAVRRPAGAPRR